MNLRSNSLRSVVRPFTARLAPASLIRWAAVIFFIWLVGRFWHPHYGFTALLQFDEASMPTAIPEMGATPLFLYPGQNGYDGLSYVQIAQHPLLNSRELQEGMGDLHYRARRILASAIAWILGAGQPAAITHAYSIVNLLAWGLLAWIAWRLLPPIGWRATPAWIGLLLSAGVLHSVRLALTDLPALALLAGAMLRCERGHRTTAAGLIGLAALTRETSLLFSPALAAPRDLFKDPTRRVMELAMVAGPLGAWLWYIHLRLGAQDPGVGNFTWPVVGFIEKWRGALTELSAEPDRWLAITTVLALVGISAQAIYLVARPDWNNPWWRAGALYTLLMLFFGGAVWNGHPGAYSRVLLPMSLSFAVLSTRRTAHWSWLVLGNLTVFAGVLTLWHVPHAPREISAGRVAGGSYVVQTGPEWHAVEVGPRRAWAWCAQSGTLVVNRWPADDAAVRLTLSVVGITTRTLEIRHDERVIWSGEIGPKRREIELSPLPTRAGHLTLQLASPEAPVREAEHAGARELSFAIYGAKCR